MKKLHSSPSNPIRSSCQHHHLIFQRTELGFVDLNMCHLCLFASLPLCSLLTFCNIVMIWCVSVSRASMVRWVGRSHFFRYRNPVDISCSNPVRLTGHSYLNPGVSRNENENETKRNETKRPFESAVSVNPSHQTKSDRITIQIKIPIPSHFKTI